MACNYALFFFFTKVLCTSFQDLQIGFPKDKIKSGDSEYY